MGDGHNEFRDPSLVGGEAPSQTSPISRCSATWPVPHISERRYAYAEACRFNPFNPNPYCSRGTTSAVLGLTATIVVPTFRQLWPNPYYSRVEKTLTKNTTETQEK